MKRHKSGAEKRKQIAKNKELAAKIPKIDSFVNNDKTGTVSDSINDNNQQATSEIQVF